ncbi:MAG: Gfo/Idh/MocA family oxidoreductase [Paracoccaceae bacterium]
MSLRAGIIGAGQIAWRYDGGAWDGARSVTHSACLDRHPDTELVAILEPAAQVRTDLRTQHPKGDALVLPERLEDFLALDLDMVTIASPSEHHARHIAACLNAGIPRLWIEKPVTLDLDAYRDLRTTLTAMEHPPRTCVNYFRRFLPQYQHLRAHLNTSPGITGVALTYSRRLDVNGVHLLDVLGFLFEVATPPPLEWLRPDAGGNPSFGLMLGDVPVTVTGHDLPYHAVDVAVTGAEGRMSVTRGGLDLVWEAACPNPDYPGFHHLAPPKPVPGFEDAGDWMRDGTFRALDALVAEGPPPASTLETAWFAQALMARALEGSGP